jgi:phospholipid/cholesterol/gamma-HCH transport system substrate-binding protein
MDARKQRLRLGLFVVAAIVLLGGMILLFGGAPQRLFASRTPYTIIFTDAPGIAVGTPVRRSGVRIGEVSAVELDDQTGEVRVQIQVLKKYSIRKNEEAVISQDLLSRDTTIDFVPTVSPSAPPALKPPEPEPTLKPPEPLPQKEGEVKPAGFFEGADNPQPPLGEPLQPGSVIRGRAPTDFRGLVSQANEIIPTLQQSLNAIRRSVERFEQTIPQLELGIREFTQLGRAIREAVPEIRRTNDEIRTLVQGARSIAPGLRRTNEELQLTLRNFGQVGETVNLLIQSNQEKFVKALDQSTDVLQRISQVLSDENQKNFTATLRAAQVASANFDGVLRSADEMFRNLNQTSKPLAERSDRILRNFDTSVEQFARLMNSFGDSMATGRGDGSVQRFLNDPSLYNNLNESAMMLARLVPRLDRILRDFEVFADKIARHPESIGVGGAVRPSAGLKESPMVGPPQPYKQRP